MAEQTGTYHCPNDGDIVLVTNGMVSPPHQPCPTCGEICPLNE